ncbi:UNVERIFIED_CONTAM: hypothetical protein Sradi_1584400, partial [Sesamum radiatum]
VFDGWPPPTTINYVTDDTSVAVVDEIVCQQRELLDTAKHHLTRTSKWMNLQADQRRRDVDLQKLSRRYFGPFRISRKIGTVAYELELSPSVRIHPIFHVSLMKPFQGETPAESSELPPEMAESEEICKPLGILGHRFEERRGYEQY